MEKEVLHLKEKQLLSKEVRELQHSVRKKEISESERLSQAFDTIRTLKEQLVARDLRADSATSFEEQVQVLEEELNKEKQRTLREQGKHQQTLTTLETRTNVNKAIVAAVAINHNSSSSSNSIGNNSSTSQQQLLVKVSDLERQLRSLKRDNAAMRGKVATTIVLEERVREMEEKELRSDMQAQAAAMVLSERNMLVEEKDNWNQQFVELLQKCRAMIGEPPIDILSNTNVQQCTVPAVLHLLGKISETTTIKIRN
jgi:hypothetical protein